MYRFTIEIARRRIQIESVWKRAFAWSRNYLTEEASDFCVASTEEEIEQRRAIYGELNNDLDPLDRDVEMSVLLSKVAKGMLDYDTLLMHGAVVAYKDKAYMFSAPSGTGKSTHIRKWVRSLPGAFVVNGDKPFIITGDTPMACGSPWCGKERWQTNKQVPLAAIVLMERGEENEIREISFKEAFPGLLRQTHRPGDVAKMEKTLHLLKSLDHKVKFYSFHFNNLKPDAFQVAYHELVEKQNE